MLALTRLYPIAGLLAGYLLVMLANPVRRALRDGFRCIARYERVWLTFALLGFAYFVFQFVTFSSVPSPSEIDFAEIIAIANWNWTPLADLRTHTLTPHPLHTAGRSYPVRTFLEEGRSGGRHRDIPQLDD